MSQELRTLRPGERVALREGGSLAEVVETREDGAVRVRVLRWAPTELQGWRSGVLPFKRASCCPALPQLWARRRALVHHPRGWRALTREAHLVAGARLALTEGWAVPLIMGALARTLGRAMAQRAG